MALPAGEPERPLIGRLRIGERHRVDEPDVVGPLTARVPEQPHLGGGCAVHAPGDAPLDRFTRLEGAPAISKLDARVVHRGATVRSNESSMSGQRSIAPFILIVQMILLLSAVNVCIVSAGILMDVVPRATPIESPTSVSVSR